MADREKSPESVFSKLQKGSGFALLSDAVVVRRPHFRLQGDSLFFLISRRPFAVLTPAVQNLWSALEKETTVGELEARLGSSAREDIRLIVDIGVAEVLTPAPPGKRRRVMIIEPHMDDAALSVGGLMLQRQTECEFFLVTVATHSVATSYRGGGRDFFDIQAISNLRKAESEIVAGMLWGRHISLGLIEATLRYYPQNWTLEWFQRHEQAVWEYLAHAPGRGELELWTSAIAKSVAEIQPEEIWMPLGVGVHVDHQLTRHACLNILRTNPKLIEKCVWRFFQDVPYAASFPNHTAALVETLRSAGVKLEKELMDVTNVKQEKMRLLSVYSSQWKIEVIQARVESCSKALGGVPERLYELWYRVLSAPEHNINMIDTSVVKNSIYRVARDVSPWFLRNKEVGKIGILLAAPVGRWADDLKYLLECFPNAHFEVHMQSKFGGHAEMFVSDRVQVRLGGDRWRWLLGDALVTILGRRLPLVIIAGRQREKKGQWLARFSLLSDPVVAATMSDFIQALQYVAQERE